MTDGFDGEMLQLGAPKLTLTLADCSVPSPPLSVTEYEVAVVELKLQVAPLGDGHGGLVQAFVSVPAAVVQTPVSVTLAPTNAEALPVIVQDPGPEVLVTVQLMVVPSELAVQVTFDGSVMVAA